MSVLQFAAPRDGEAAFWSAYGISALGLPGRPECGDCFAVHSPHGEACFWSAYDTTPLGLPGARERCGCFAVRNTQGRRSFTIPLGSPEAYESGVNFAIRGPPGRRGRILACVWHHSSQESPKVPSVSQFAVPRDGEASFCFAYDTTPLGLPGAHESVVCLPARSSQGRRGLILVCV